MDLFLSKLSYHWLFNTVIILGHFIIPLLLMTEIYSESDVVHTKCKLSTPISYRTLCYRVRLTAHHFGASIVAFPRARKASKNKYLFQFWARSGQENLRGSLKTARCGDHCGQRRHILH
jgi:hypothetical protein